MICFFLVFVIRSEFSIILYVLTCNTGKNKTVLRFEMEH